MNQPAKSHEPSMEEILASIRRIIADDDAKAPPAAAEAVPPAPAAAPAPMAATPPSPMEFLRDIPPAPPPPAPPPAPEEEVADILELTDDMRAPERERPAMQFTTVNAQPDIVFAESMPEPEPVEPEPEPEPESPEPVLSELDLPAADPLEHARQTLTEQMEMDRPLLSRSTSVAVDSAFASLTHTVLSQNARTLDDLVKDMLRPMLKSWLDDNLPSLVERLVRAEIERVSRGR
jgi:cell pole-organizing protein PopZ